MVSVVLLGFYRVFSVFVSPFRGFLVILCCNGCRGLGFCSFSVLSWIFLQLQNRG